MNSSQLEVIGSGEAFDAAFGNTSYLFSGPDHPSILFDCGYQIPERLWSRGLHVQLDAVCLTHLHADHFFGVVPLLARYWEEGRTEALHLFGPRGTEAQLKKLFELGYPGFFKRLKFKLVFRVLSPARPLVWKGIRFSSASTVHSVPNLTIRVDLPGRARLSFAVSGDGRLTEATRALVKDVGLLLQEVYTARPVVPTHADLETVAEFVGGAALGKIGVAHLSREGRDEVLAGVRRLRLRDKRWVVVKPGMRFGGRALLPGTD